MRRQMPRLQLTPRRPRDRSVAGALHPASRNRGGGDSAAAPSCRRRRFGRDARPPKRRCRACTVRACCTWRPTGSSSAATRRLRTRPRARSSTTPPRRAGSRPGDNPLLRSGLAFAGANARGGTGEDDGILTALEASSLDLWGTRMAVLSACETGVGETRRGDGVYGLRRALVVAGAESQVMSLWQVSDEGTRVLMTDFYTKLKAGVARSAALREVQLQMLRAGTRKHPVLLVELHPLRRRRSDRVSVNEILVLSSSAQAPQAGRDPRAEEQQRGRFRRLKDVELRPHAIE